MNKDALNFQKLTPLTNVVLGIYDKALNFVFANNDIRNIAISGAYSAGKSSILETYKKGDPKKRYIHISLAHFESPDAESDKDRIKESVLEGKILNQLIHQISPDKIPQTNFRVKNSITSRSIIILAALILLFFLSLLHVIFFSQWENYVHKILPTEYFDGLLNFVSDEVSLLLSGIGIVILGFFFILNIVSSYKNKNIFRKVSVQGAEIEIFEESEDSYFDKYLNDVLYLFENSEADVIVFEDMDRYNSNQIFERLREVNFLVNNIIYKRRKRYLGFFIS